MQNSGVVVHHVARAYLQKQQHNKYSHKRLCIRFITPLSFLQHLILPSYQFNQVIWFSREPKEFFAFLVFLSCWLLPGLRLEFLHLFIFLVWLLLGLLEFLHFFGFLNFLDFCFPLEFLEVRQILCFLGYFPFFLIFLNSLISLAFLCFWILDFILVLLNCADFLVSRFLRFFLIFQDSSSFLASWFSLILDLLRFLDFSFASSWFMARCTLSASALGLSRSPLLQG